MPAPARQRGQRKSIARAPIRIRRVESMSEGPRLRRIFREYSRLVGANFRWEGFDEELRSLPLPYLPPRGALLVAERSGRILGMVALRPWSGRSCEMKRLYVRPRYQGYGLGRALILAILREARTLGYTRMRLDTLYWMRAARKLYGALGFHSIPPYLPSPGAKTYYLERTL